MAYNGDSYHDMMEDYDYHVNTGELEDLYDSEDNKVYYDVPKNKRHRRNNQPGTSHGDSHFIGCLVMIIIAIICCFAICI